MLHLFCVALNNNSFLLSVFVQTPVVLIPSYFLILKCGRLEGLTEEMAEHRFWNFTFIWFFVVVGHYLRMKALATVVI